MDDPSFHGAGTVIAKVAVIFVCREPAGEIVDALQRAAVRPDLVCSWQVTLPELSFPIGAVSWGRLKRAQWKKSTRQARRNTSPSCEFYVVAAATKLPDHGR